MVGLGIVIGPLVKDLPRMVLRHTGLTDVRDYAWSRVTQTQGKQTAVGSRCVCADKVTWE